MKDLFGNDGSSRKNPPPLPPFSHKNASEIKQNANLGNDGSGFSHDAMQQCCDANSAVKPASDVSVEGEVEEMQANTEVFANTPHSGTGNVGSDMSTESPPLGTLGLGTLETTALPDWWWETVSEGGAILPDLVVDRASIPEPTPAAHQCPACGTELDFSEGETAVCVGCGRAWKLMDGKLVEAEPPEPPKDDGSPEPLCDNCDDDCGGGNTSSPVTSQTHQVLENASHSSQISDTLPSEPLTTDNLPSDNLPPANRGDNLGSDNLPASPVSDNLPATDNLPAASRSDNLPTTIADNLPQTDNLPPADGGDNLGTDNLPQTDNLPTNPVTDNLPTTATDNLPTTDNLGSDNLDPSDNLPSATDNLPSDNLGNLAIKPIGKAISFLRRVLADGEKPAAEVLEAAKREGISKITLYRAKALLKVVSRKVGDTWYWSLPSSEGSPEPPQGSPTPPSPAGGGDTPPSHPSPTPPFPESAPQTPTSPPFTESPSHQSL